MAHQEEGPGKCMCPRNPNLIDLVEICPTPTMSVRHAVQHTQQTLKFPVKVKDNPCEQTVPKAEASNRDKALDMFLSVVDSELINAPDQKTFLTLLLMSGKPCVTISGIPRL